MHIQGCLSYALQLAQRYGASEEEISTVALLHDSWRGTSPEELLRLARLRTSYLRPIEIAYPDMLHGYLAACWSEELHLNLSTDLFWAIAWHTSGHPGFGKVGSILYIADALEESRSYPGVAQLREQVAHMNLAEAALLIVQRTLIDYLQGHGYSPDPLTLAWEQKLLASLGGNDE